MPFDAVKHKKYSDKSAFPAVDKLSGFFNSAKTFFDANPDKPKMRRIGEKKIKNSFIRYKKDDGSDEILMLARSDLKSSKGSDHFNPDINCAYLGKGGFAKAKVAMNEDGEYFAVRIEQKKSLVTDSKEVDFGRKTGLIKGVINRSEKGINKEYQVQKLGVSLRKFLQSATLTEAERFRIALRITEKVQELHEKHNIAHLDIKPDNIIIDETTHEITLIDFGLSEESPNKALNDLKGTELYSPTLKSPF